MGRLFLCLVVVAWWCLVAVALLSPVHGRVGLAAGEVGGDQRPAPAISSDHVAEKRGVKSSRPSWSSWPSTSRRGAEAVELRSVPAGPDPMHHHGSPRRPEHEEERIGP
uniref:Uncharacterized protein n=1 Tax=Oryza brachyantha TaxID=4533 RepID=J3N9E9_ORYBR